MSRDEEYKLILRTFSSNLRIIRKYRKISVITLAKLTKTHKMCIYSYERGASFPTIVSLARLAEALDTSIDILVGRGVGQWKR